MWKCGNVWDTVGRYGALWGTEGHETPWQSTGHFRAEWDTVGHCKVVYKWDTVRQSPVTLLYLPCFRNTMGHCGTLKQCGARWNSRRNKAKRMFVVLFYCILGETSSCLIYMCCCFSRVGLKICFSFIQTFLRITKNPQSVQPILANHVDHV